MNHYEYRVVPAPTRGPKAKGAKTPEDRFARSLEELMNEMATEGWEYQRAETLPQEERSGLTGTSTTFRNLLVFRRHLGRSQLAAPQPAPAAAEAPAPLAAPVRNTPPARPAHAEPLLSAKPQKAAPAPDEDDLPEGYSGDDPVRDR